MKGFRYEDEKSQRQQQKYAECAMYIMGTPEEDMEDKRGLRLAKVVEIIGAFLAAEEISMLAYKSEVFLQSTHLQRSEHGTNAVKHSQYFFKQADFLQ